MQMVFAELLLKQRKIEKKTSKRVYLKLFLYSEDLFLFFTGPRLGDVLYIAERDLVGTGNSERIPELDSTCVIQDGPCDTGTP